MLAIRAPDARSGAVPLGQGHEGCHDCFEVGLDQRQSVAHLQHEGGIDDVLRGCALVEAPFQLLREPPLHGFDERNGRDARQSRAVAQSSEVEVLGRGCSDRGCEWFRYKSAARLYLRQGGLSAQHGGKTRTIGEHGAHRVGGEQRPEKVGVEGRERHRSTPMKLMKDPPQIARATIIFLISAMAFAGLRPFGQVLAQFMIVWQR
jgi:hypothetical protein